MEIIEPDLDNVMEGDNPRLDYGTDADELNLGNSLAKHQDYPILIRVHPTLAGFFEIVDGHRRCRAARRVKIKTLKALVVEGSLTEADIRLIMLRTDLQKKKLTEPERCRLVKQIEAAHPGITRKALAEMLDLNPPVITQILTEGIPEVERAFEAGQIGLAKRYELAKGTPEQQEAQLAAALSGASRESLASRRSKPKADAVRASSIKCPLPSGNVVTIKGEELSLDEALEVLADAAKAIKEGIRRNWTAKTFGQAMKDMAAS